MIKKDQYGMQCSQFETLLGDALDELLTGAIQEAFEAHGQSCSKCGPLLADARQGMLLLQGLEEVEPPRNLIHNILAATTAAEGAKQSSTGTARKSWLPSWLPMLTVQPRFVTSFAMAFFSLSLTLTLAGVRFKDLARMDWRPNSMRKAVVLQYTQVENRVVKYYQNMRLVYEIESRVRELRKAADTPQEDNKQQDPQKQNRNLNDNDDTSERPENRQDRYSQGMDNSVIASLNTSHEGA
jgi:hypothetical protein